MARNSRFVPEALYSVGCDARFVGGELLVRFVQPFRAAAVHEANVVMAVNFEEPKTVGGEPVIVVAVNNHGVVGRDAGAADQFFECFAADDVAANLVLELRLPVEADRAGDMAGVVGLGIDVNLDEFDVWFAEVFFDPIGRNEDFRMCVTGCHKTFLRPPCRHSARQCVWPCLTCI